MTKESNNDENATKNTSEKKNEEVKKKNEMNKINNEDEQREKELDEKLDKHFNKWPGTSSKIVHYNGKQMTRREAKKKFYLDYSSYVTYGDVDFYAEYEDEETGDTHVNLQKVFLLVLLYSIGFFFSYFYFLK